MKVPAVHRNVENFKWRGGGGWMKLREGSSAPCPLAPSLIKIASLCKMDMSSARLFICNGILRIRATCSSRGEAWYCHEIYSVCKPMCAPKRVLKSSGNFSVVNYTNHYQEHRVNYQKSSYFNVRNCCT